MRFGPNISPPQGHILYKGLFRENMKKSSCLQQYGIANYGPWAKNDLPWCHQGSCQLSTDTYIYALNKTQVGDSGPFGHIVLFLTLTVNQIIALIIWAAT